MDSLRIGNLRIGRGEPIVVIAEFGINHNGDHSLARRLVIEAATAGAQIVKGQMFRAEEMVAGQNPNFQRLRDLELPLSVLQGLSREAVSRKAVFTASVFDTASADVLDSLGSPVFKIASGELTNLPLLRHVAAKGKPMLVSVGMASAGEIEEALDSIYAVGNRNVALLHCVSSYPTNPDEANLARIPLLKQLFDVPVGFSDHTIGLTVPLSAVAVGADFLEKHFTLDKTLPGPDHALSADPGELSRLVREAQVVRRAIGSPIVHATPSEREMRVLARKSLCAKRDLKAGQLISPEDLVSLRPATGLSPKYQDTLVGRRAKRDIRAGEPLDWDSVA